MGMCGLTGDMRYADVILDEPLVMIEESSNEGKRRRKRQPVEVGENGEVREFKSKNLQCERDRRHKLNQRMLTLRSLVPNITNMSKPTIIDDAMKYIKELQGYVEQLTDQLQEMDAKAYFADEEEPEYQENQTTGLMQEKNQNPIKAEVELTVINHNKLWLKLVFDSKRCGFKNLMEALNFLRLEPTDISLTTSRGAILISSCIQGNYGQVLEVDKIQNLLKEFIGSSI